MPEPVRFDDAVGRTPPAAGGLIAGLLRFLTADDRGLAAVAAGPLILLTVLAEALTSGSSWLVAASSLVASLGYLAVRLRGSEASLHLLA